MQAEIDLLICCTRTQLDSERVERIKHLLTWETDWKSVIFLGTQHRVLPLLFHHLKQISPDKIPPEVFTHLQTFFSQHTFWNLKQTAEIIRLIDLLKQNEIPAISFKGPTLALSVYGNVASRQFDDLDILVAPSDFLKAREVLMTQGGYESPTPDYFFSTEQELAYLRSSYECSLVHPIHKTVIDLHQHLTGKTFLSYPFSFQDLYKNVVSVPPNHQLFTLHPEDLLLYLCVHGAKSLWARLIWICDIAELIRANPDINWEKLLEQAKTTKTERMLLLGLRLAEQVLGIELPAIVVERIKADSALIYLDYVQIPSFDLRKNDRFQIGFGLSLAQQIHQQILAGKCGLSSQLDLEKMIFQCRTMADFKQKIKYCLRCFHHHGKLRMRRLFRLAKKDRLFVNLPSHLYFLYYLIRPIRLFGVAIAKAVRWPISQS